jgi:ribosome-binding protein aMBF1 (putative translation factor)
VVRDESSSDERDRHLNEAAETIVNLVRQLGITHDELARRMRASESVVERGLERAATPASRPCVSASR